MITLAVTIEDLAKIEAALDVNMDDLRRAVAAAEAHPASRPAARHGPSYRWLGNLLPVARP